MAEEAKVFTPPVLYKEGAKVQSAWLFDFLKEPIALRPWLDVRMPVFHMTEDEATASCQDTLLFWKRKNIHTNLLLKLKINIFRKRKRKNLDI